MEKPTDSCKGGTVHLNSGRFALRLPGLSIPGIGAGWSFNLTHLSNVSQGVDVPAFESRQQARIVIVDNKGDTNPDNDDVAVVTGRFKKVVYRFKEKVGNVIYYLDADGATARLTKDAVADEYTLTSPRQTVAKFHGFNTPGVAPGRLKSIRSASGDEFTFQYTQIGGEWHLTRELDTAGRAIDYSYAAVAGKQVLREVTDFLGRKITLQYDSATGNLVAMIGPTVTLGAPGNTFLGGKAYVLQYDTGNADPNRRKDIIKVFFPKQVAPDLNTATRTVGVAAVYANATPRHVITYGQNAADPSTHGRVMSERIGDGAAVGGTYQFSYQFAAYGASLPAGVALRTTMTDPSGNVTGHDFDSKGNRVRLEVRTNRAKSSKNPASFVTTWEYSATDNLLLRQTFPEGNSVEYTYHDGVIRDPATLVPLFTLRSRVGFLLKETHKPGPRGGDQAELTTRYFPDPVFSRELVRIDPRGNPIDAAGTYFTPQNGGPPPTDTDRSRYATWTRYDYEEDGSDANKQALADLLGITLTQFNQLLAWQDKVLKDGGLPQGYSQCSLGSLPSMVGDGNKAMVPGALLLWLVNILCIAFGLVLIFIFVTGVIKPKEETRSYVVHISDQSLVITRGGGSLALAGNLLIIAVGLLVIIGFVYNMIFSESPKSILSTLSYSSAIILGFVILMFGVWISCGRIGVTIDRNKREVVTWWGLLGPMKKQVHLLDGFDSVTMRRETQGGFLGLYVVFIIRLEGKNASIIISDDITSHSTAMELAENVATASGVIVRDLTARSGES